MAAAITTTATSLEKQLFEVAGKMQELEVAATAANEEFEQLMNIAIDAEGGSVTLSITLPATIASTGGILTFTPAEYL